MARDDALYRYIESAEEIVEIAGQTYTYWTPLAFLGIYGNAEETERDARLAVSWLKKL